MVLQEQQKGFTVTGQKAFTLIELLVVISIIAILMAIMMPVLGRVRSQALGVVCQANLKSYGTAGIMYLQDSDSRFPDSFTWLHKDGNKSITDSCAWHNAKYLADGTLWSYLKAKDAHMCPQFRRLAKSMGCRDPQHKAHIPVNPQYSYAMNALLGAGTFGIVEKATRMRNPDATLYFSEENLWPNALCLYVLNNNNLLLYPADGRIPNPGVSGIMLYNNIATYHKAKGADLNSGVANIAFVDGHVGTGSAQNGYFLGAPRGVRVPVGLSGF